MLAELEEMEQAELDEQLLDVETPASELPEIPEVRKFININKKDTAANKTSVSYLGYHCTINALVTLVTSIYYK